MSIILNFLKLDKSKDMPKTITVDDVMERGRLTRKCKDSVMKDLK